MRTNYDIALEVVKEVSYSGWRTFNPEDTLRFHALRLHEVGIVKSGTAEANCRWTRLAIPERAEEGTQGVRG